MAKGRGGAVLIDVDPRGNPWVVNDSGQIYQHQNNGYNDTVWRTSCSETELLFLSGNQV